MVEIGAYDLKRKLSELLRDVESGKEYLITNRGKPVARLIPAAKPIKRPTSEVVDELLAFPKAVKPSGMSIKAMTEEGRR